MQIISWNVNGLRAAYKKGFCRFVEKEDADFYCLQEIKANKDQLPSDLVNPKGYYSYFNSAQKRGYSGVVVYAKKKPISIVRKIGIKKFNNEGRYLELKYPNFTLINIYIPHGGRQKENLKYKLLVYEKIHNKLSHLKNKKVIFIGDFNIAHTEKDLERPKQNQKNIMFTPEERKQIDIILNFGFVDSFRKFHNKKGNYTWWPYAFNARERNLGWRIDYGFVSRKLTNKLKTAHIYTNTKGSDHCPIGMGLAIK